MENPFLQDNAVENIVSWHMNTQNEPLTCHNIFIVGNGNNNEQTEPCSRTLVFVVYLTIFTFSELVGAASH